MNKFIIIISLILTGCATPYQKYNDGIFSSKTGFSDYQIAQNAFSISFKANSLTDKSQASIFALKRAAEITCQHNFRYFTVEYMSDQTELRACSRINTSGSMTTDLYQFPGLILHIKCYNDNPPADAYNATDHLNFRN